MVSSTNPENGEPAPSIRPSTAEGIPPGDYLLVGWDMDLTGKKLIDEICQIACYTSTSSFAQYVMPFKNLTPPARKRHNLKVVTIGKYRMLKNSQTNKVIKTKSEISAIMDFLDWLENIKGNAKDGIILVHHESRKVNSPILLDVLIKYKLLERFKKTVKGFVNGFDVANNKCASTLRAFSLRTLSRIFLDQEVQWDNAANRARLVLQIIQYLSNNEENDKVDIVKKESSDGTSKSTIEFIREFVQPIDAEEKEYKVLKLVLERQDNLKPLFQPLLQMTRRERQHASPLRRLLAEANNTWSDGQEIALEKLIKEKLDKATEKEIEDLIVIIESHFDPTKNAAVNIEHKQKKRGSKKSQDKSKSKTISSCDASPDTTTCSPGKENFLPRCEVEAK
ncbi:hypothetical protein PV326_010916 [Microctonus aethiopoides]|nr:hypothetical protein PV326_010916 [Microctonus aethiopoides]